MSKNLEELLKARLKDPRAMRGAIQFVKGKPRVVLGVVGNHPRISIEVDGNDLNIVDDKPAAPEKKAESGQDGKSGGKGSAKGDKAS